MADKTTIIEIAKESGVSIATVSRVLNGTVPVAPQTRERVEAVIRKYNYSPNALARGLVSRQSMSIGVLMPDISNPYFSTIFSEIESAAHEAGYSTMLCNTLYRSENNSCLEEEYMQMLMDKHVDGVIIAGGQQDLVNPGQGYLDALKRLASSLPLVMVGERIEDIPCIFLDRENADGVLTAVRHLVELGHRRIAFLGGEDGIKITRSRISAYEESLKTFGIRPDPSLIFLSDYYVKDGYAAAKSLIAANASCTAAIAVNDNVALGAMRAFIDHGLNVPKDISLISCEQFPNAAYYFPRLTSVDRHSELLGRRVIRTLLQAMKNGAGAQNTDPILAELIVRDSCCTPASQR
ncbi:MAG: LacI family DNA-binding transcriptional regulator [Eubacteriales bacterium]|nr:LacI family DNA-binding transcriptional regulator [Eubacteriales bacterium]